MGNTIGEKIKALRKSLKLTQSQLAGNEMTKSMLSQIENNLATPSMKNLIYLASKLEKPVSYFLEDENSEDFSEETLQSKDSLPLEKIQEEVKNINSLIYKNKISEAKEKLTIILDKYEFDKNSTLYADVIYKLGMCQAHTNELNESENMLNSAIKIYESNLLFAEAAKAYIELIYKPWNHHNYGECLKILDEAYEVYKKSIKTDELFEIEYLYNKALVNSALGYIDETFLTINEAINISTKTQMYYKSDEIYRLYANLYFTLERYDDFLYNINKAKQFAEFTENNTSLGLIEIAFCFYENEAKNPHKALEHIEKSLHYLGEKTYLYYLEKAKSYYILENYEEALNNITKVKFTTNQHHTYDLLLMWSSKVYEGLINHKLGNTSEGIKSILYAIEQMETKPNSKFLVFAYKSLSEVYSENGDFEKAFKALKKANDIEVSLKGLPYTTE